MTTPNLMTPENPRWPEFTRRLSETLFYDDDHLRWYCDGDGTGDSDPALAHRYARQILAQMGGVDVDGSLAFFCENGGYCDCEILFNVDPEAH